MQPSQDTLLASFLSGVAGAHGRLDEVPSKGNNLPNMASKGRPYRTVLVEDFEVLIGRNASDNDRLSLKMAAPRDGWLHVAGSHPGSHVVIRNPQGVELPGSVVRRAAQYAAWYSKARGLPKVEVHFCRAGDVSKERGAPAGQVRIKRFRRVFVIPAPVEDEAGENSL